MLENISKINYLCDFKKVRATFVIIYVLLGFCFFLVRKFWFLVWVVDLFLDLKWAIYIWASKPTYFGAYSH